jgi:hydroxymethylglutaryl-CoA lyase
VPQLADNAQVMAGIRRRPGVRYAVLTPNLQGLQAALATRPDEVVVFGAASEAFSQRNINCSVAESIERFRPVVAAAHEAGVKVRAAVPCALGCPYQGEVTPAAVERVVHQLRAIGVDHCGIADTLGVGTPRRVQAVMERALEHYPLADLSGHFHDTYGQALANILACLQLGIRTYDTSIAGLGGCPYARGASGNVATEDVVFMLHGMGIATGLDLEALVDAGAWISGVLGRPPVSRAGRALLARRGVAEPAA